MVVDILIWGATSSTIDYW